MSDLRKTAAGPSPRTRESRRLATALLFVGPNLLGFLAFTALPLILSFGMAFTNYNLQRNNELRAAQPDLGVVPLTFVGGENFAHLASEPRLLEYFGNTLFLMMGIPFNIAGSLFLAVLLSRDLHAGSGTPLRTGARPRTTRALLAAAALMAFGVMAMLLAGAGGSAMVVLVGGLVATIFLGGMAAGSTLYRTLFYLPNFTAGVAVYMLWKRLYSVRGPIYNALLEPLDWLTKVLRSSEAARLAFHAAAAAMLLLLAYVLFRGVRGIARRRADADVGHLAMLPALAAVAAPLVALVIASRHAFWGSSDATATVPPAATPAFLLVILTAVLWALAWRRPFRPVRPWEGLGGTLFFSALLMVAGLILVGLAAALHALPGAALAPRGLRPPDFLNSFAWAKPALMVMGFWAAVGSNNMLLYLAGISNVPQELYEAADIDGASRSQKFWNVTWPQLAPTTFFIVIMSVIHGLQGGFDAARVMTQGQAGTTTLTYFIFNKTYQEAALNQAAAIAWVLFALVFVVTLFNWKVGNQYVNE